MVELKRLPGR